MNKRITNTDLGHIVTTEETTRYMCQALVDCIGAVDGFTIDAEDSSHGKDSILRIDFSVGGFESAVSIKQYFDTHVRRSIVGEVHVRREHFAVSVFKDTVSPDGIADGDMCEVDTFITLVDAVGEVGSIVIKDQISCAIDSSSWEE